ncbi:MAG: tetratricopeptide repeat protein [Betaproteobacteria bacterium]|nr:tetratricopeptide repeat protein [Betaproteobacteria bacterium]
MSAHAQDVNNADFENAVIEKSKTVPVLVDFWAEWCAPCRALKPVLEKLANEYQGKFVLAKVNSDENQALAQRYGVRGIPNVKAFVGGELVDEFAGALPEVEVRAFLARIIPSPAEKARLDALADYAATGDAQQALGMLAAASRLDPQNENVRVDCAEILLRLNQHDEARQLLASLSPLAQMEERVQTLQAKLALASNAGGGDADALLKRIAADAKDSAARLELARLYIAQSQHAKAMDQLLEIVRRDRKFEDDIARKTMLQLFSVLGGEHPLTAEYRRKLAGALN